MILTGDVLDGIRAGAITCARSGAGDARRSGTGGTPLTAAGQLEILAVTRIERHDISDADARRAGYDFGRGGRRRPQPA